MEEVARRIAGCVPDPVGRYATSRLQTCRGSMLVGGAPFVQAAPVIVYVAAPGPASEKPWRRNGTAPSLRIESFSVRAPLAGTVPKSSCGGEAVSCVGSTPNPSNGA